MRVIVMRAVRWISDAQCLPEEISDEVQWDEEFSSDIEAYFSTQLWEWDV